MPSRTPLLLATAIAALATAVPTASAATSCTYDPARHHVELAVNEPARPGHQKDTVLWRSGDQIQWYETSLGASGDCGAATVRNTERIHVQLNTNPDVSPASMLLIVSTYGGPLAPGFTPEPDGLAEIEIEASIAITTESDNVRLAYGGLEDRPNTIVAGGGGINGNGDQDADITWNGVADLRQLNVLLEGGEKRDRITALGGGGTGGRLENPVSITGRGGNDTLQAGAAHAYLNGMDGDDLLLGGIFDDTLVGGAGRDVLRANAGDDTLQSDDGELDELLGGTGLDTARADDHEARFQGIERVV